MAIKICDAIMGSGKSSAAITYMNEHANQKFIYITPYLDEAQRIIDSCPALRFEAPNTKTPGTGFTKTGHTAWLLEAGRNIASTHQAFKYYTQDMIESIKRHGYTLFIDESLEAVTMYDGSVGDLNLLVRAGYLETDGRKYWMIDDQYDGVAMRDTLRLVKSQDLIRYQNDDGSDRKENAYWAITPELLSSFSDVVVMTYLFEGQGIHHMLLMHGIEYEFIGITRTDGVFRFSDHTNYMPPSAGRLAELIHICDHRKLNSIGDKEHALSLNWFKKNKDLVTQLKNNLGNYFTHIMREYGASPRMWATYSNQKSKLAAKGFTTKYVVFNERATNAYRDRTVLAYLANPYMNVGLKNFYAAHGADVSHDTYALSTLVQWIWRSAIRDGKEIYLYLPSSRMRTLLVNWMEDVKKQYDEWLASQTEGGEQGA